MPSSTRHRSARDELTFHALPAPTRADIADISRRVYRRTRALFISLGRDWEQPEQMDELADLQEPLLSWGLVRPCDWCSAPSPESHAVDNAT